MTTRQEPPQLFISDRVDILLVDDREENLITLEAVLNNPGYRLVKARSGSEAVALLPLYDFGLILLDVQMPELDGFDTAEIIRKHSAFSHIPIVFVTSEDEDASHIYRSYQVGAVDCICKPVDPLILRSKVEVFADMQRLARERQRQAHLLAECEAVARKAEIESVETEGLRRYRKLADAIPHIVLLARAEGALEYHNQQWTAFTGLSAEESLGLGWQKAIQAEDLQKLLSTSQQALSGGTRFAIECRLRRRDGAFRWHWLQADPELNEKREVIAWLGTCTDIHDRKMIEEEITEARVRAELASRAKTQFLTNISHEIRTPLNAIMGFTELILDPIISMEEKLRSVAIIRRNSNQLMKIVDEILDISKVEAGGLAIEATAVSLVNLLDEIKALMRVQAERKAIALEVSLEAQVPDTVFTDSTRLRQILGNVIGNAIKFTRSGKVEVNVGFTPGPGPGPGSRLTFLVSDTGIGMEAAAAERIFEPFSQADASATRLFGGTGLGLALSRRLARALGGDIRLCSTAPDQGSRFEVSVAVEVPESAGWIPPTEKAEGSPENSTSEVKEPLRGMNILLVEDAEDNQFLIQRFLNRAGAIVDLACNGEEGVQKALAGDYALVLMDIQMPFVDGYQATARLRSACYSRPIIALTAHALSEERERSLNSGCSGHLTKPISRQQLVEALLPYAPGRLSPGEPLSQPPLRQADPVP